MQLAVKSPVNEAIDTPMLGSRRGMNPSRSKKSTYHPARVTAAVLVHIPNLVGYFEHRLPVLKACLNSLVQNAGAPLDLMVFDNASCEEVGAYLTSLHAEGRIDFLLSSHTNLGKIGALQLMFRAAPGEVVAYTDDDFYFHPGWLDAQLQVVDTYPRVGMVSGYTLPRFFAAERISANLAFAASNPAVTHRQGKFIPESWIRDWAVSSGRDPGEAVKDQAQHQEHYLEFHGVPAYAAANHDQFLTLKSVMEACLPKTWSGNLMGDMLALDQAVNDAGYLRLSTSNRTVQHLGNRLDLTAAGGPAELPAAKPPHRQRGGRLSGWGSSILKSPPVRYLLLGVYSKLFRLVNPK